MKKSILLIITGSIAAVKTLDLIRKLTAADYEVIPVMTKAAEKFVTPMSIAVLSGNKVYNDLFSLEDETEMGHIQLSRKSDLVVVVPASADIIAKMANGFADDLASTVLLATDKPVMIAPAMNVKMWENKAVQRNIASLKKNGVAIIGPASGTLACGEEGQGRMSEPEQIFGDIENHFKKKDRLKGIRILVTAGPTYEPIDPVRYIANRSSGKQGYAIAESLSQKGADVILISGPTNLTPPPVLKNVVIESADEMQKAVEQNLPADIAIFCAAVADWKVKSSAENKIKKRDGGEIAINLTTNPDIASSVGNSKSIRPKLVIAFAAETENLISNARKKLKEKGCDWIIANDVSNNKVFGSEENQITFLTEKTQENWPKMDKRLIAEKLTEKIIEGMKT